MIGVERRRLAVADVDGPAGLGIVVDRAGDAGKLGCSWSAIGRFESQLLPPTRRLEKSVRTKLPFAGAAGAVGGERLDA